MRDTTEITREEQSVVKGGSVESGTVCGRDSKLGSGEIWTQWRKINKMK